MSSSYSYVGTELELFAEARNWKSYFREVLAPYIRGDVLEVGAGIGATTEALREIPHGKWTALEPDAGLAGRIRTAPGGVGAGPLVEVVVGTLQELPPERLFDTVTYIDVLEHIEDDVGEMERAAVRLRPGGRLIVLAPANQRLFSRFDAAIGHFRRYDKRSLSRVVPRGFVVEKLAYLDSLGLLLSLANRHVLRQGTPTDRQIRFWDRVVVPASRALDPLLGERIGKTIVGVWRRQA